MKKQRILEVIEKNQPIEKKKLFDLLQKEDKSFTWNALKIHISRLITSEEILENTYNGILTVNRLQELVLL